MVSTLVPTAGGSRSDKPEHLPTGRMSAQSLAQMPAHRLYALLSSTRRQQMMDVIDATLRLRIGLRSTHSTIEDLCRRLNEIGIPLDRYGSSSTVLTPDADAVGRVWTKDTGVKENRYIKPPGDDPDYERSPFYEAAALQEWVELHLADTPDERFGIVAELKMDGYTHYLCAPFFLGNDANGWVTMATRAPSGFSTEDLASFALLVPSLARLIDARVGWVTLDRLLRTYVGDEPHRAILDGNVKRGQVSTIRSAILFADMRDSTGHTAELSAVQAVELFNDFFDNLVPPIEALKGEVLKYIGDGLLAIFRDRKNERNSAAVRALEAAEHIFRNMEAFNAKRPGRRPIDLGIALHFGEAAYGNVGSGQRLDFTVVGRDVGLASRIGGMNARLGEPLLMSQAFVERLGRPVLPLGAFAARGFTAPVAVFRPL